MSHPPVVALEDVSVRIEGRVILGPISLRISARERWALLGPNGSGKTTLSSVIGARQQPSAGAVSVLGVTLGRGDVRLLRERIGHSSHALSDRISPGMRLIDVVLTGKRSVLAPWLQAYEGGDVARALEQLAYVGCAELSERAFGTCSQGERQRALLARAMFGDPDLLVLDEPAAGLDLPARERLVAAIDSSSGHRPSLTAVLTTHHLEEIPNAITHAGLLRRGHLVASGTVERVLTNEALSECFEMPIEAGRRRGRWFGAAAGR